jgi:hypothetical protein
VGIPSGRLFFREVIDSYVEALRFVRRDWLARELTAHLDESGSRFVILVAEPGAGKSGFIAQLASEHPDWLVYFARRDQRSAFADRGVRSFLLHVGFQLAALHPEAFVLDQVKLEVEQRLGQVDADVVGVEVKRIVSSPFHQTVVRIRQAVDLTGGEVTGMRIGEWVADPRLLAVEDLESVALYGPARTIARLAPQARITILIDAVDESDGADGASVIDWLTSCPPLPSNVRLVITSRPLSSRWELFRARRSEGVAELRISAADERVERELLAFATEFCRGLPESVRREEVARRLARRADGNIGYLAAIGRAFDAARIDPEPVSLQSVLGVLEALPADLRGLYAFFLGQFREGPGRKDVRVQDPATGRVALVEAWGELYHPILSVLAAAFEPLTVDQIHVLCGTLASRAQASAVLEQLAQFLDRVGDGYRFYHATVGEFLLAADTRDDPATTGLYVDGLFEHRRLARLLAADLGLVWQNAPLDPKEQARRVYARFHYLEHVAAGQDFEQLFRVIDEHEYGREKLAFDPSALLYASDLELAIRAAMRAGRDDATRIREFSRLFKYRLLRSKLSAYAAELPLPIYSLLLVFGRQMEAYGLAELIPVPERQARAFAEMAHVLAQQPDSRVEAASLLRRAYDAASGIEDAETRDASVLELLDRGVGLAGLEPEQPQPLAELALPLIRRMENWRLRGSALGLAARILELQGDHHSAVEALRTEAARIEEQGLGGSLATVTASEDTPHDQMLGPRYVEQARQLAARREHEGARAALERALAVSRQPEERNAVLIQSEAALLFAEMGDPATANRVAEELLAFALGSIPGPSERPSPTFRVSLTAIEAGRELARIGRPDLAFQIGHRLGPHERNAVLYPVVQALVRAGDWDRALAIEPIIRESMQRSGGVSLTWGGLPDPPEDHALLVIAEGIAKARDRERALSVVDRIERLDVRLEALSLVARESYFAEEHEAAGELVSRVLAEVRRGEIAADRASEEAVALAIFVRTRDFGAALSLIASSSSRYSMTAGYRQLFAAMLSCGALREAFDAIRRNPEALSRAEMLVELASHVAGRAGPAGVPSPGELLLEARSLAVDVTDHVRTARLKRRIAIASFDLDPSLRQSARSVLVDSVEVLNKAPPFRSVPTPWPETFAAFAKIGDFEFGEKQIAALIEHDPFDGCVALIEVAAVARGRADVERARALLSRAVEVALLVDFPPRRDDLLCRVAKALAAMADLDSAFELEARLTSNGLAELRRTVVVALLERGELAEARRIWEAMPASYAKDAASRRLVELYLESSRLEEATLVVAAVEAPRDHADLSVLLGAKLLSSGKRVEGLGTLSRALELARGLDRWAAANCAKAVVESLVSSGEVTAAVDVVEETWTSSPSHDDLLRNLNLLEPFAELSPGAGQALLDSLAWMDAALSGPSGTPAVSGRPSLPGAPVEAGVSRRSTEK